MTGGSLSDLFGQADEQREVTHPFDFVFGKRINRYIQAEDMGTIGIHFDKFKEIKWENGLSTFTCDLLEYMCGFSMRQHLIEKNSLKEDEKRKDELDKHIKNEKQKAQ